MAESVDALVSNTSGETHPGSSPGLGTRLESKVCWLSISYNTLFYFWCNIGATILDFHIYFVPLRQNMVVLLLIKKGSANL